MALKNTYARLSEFGVVPFQFPPMACGDYVVLRPFGGEAEFFVRRMPRRAKYTGRYGLFYYDPDAHEQLIGVWMDDKWECVQPGVYQKEYHLFFPPDGAIPARTLKQRRCAWCGRALNIENASVHPTKSCTERGALKAAKNPDAGVF